VKEFLVRWAFEIFAIRGSAFRFSSRQKVQVIQLSFFNGGKYCESGETGKLTRPFMSNSLFGQAFGKPKVFLFYFRVVLLLES